MNQTFPSNARQTRCAAGYLTILAVCLFSNVTHSSPLQDDTMSNATINQNTINTANQTIVPNERINWIKNPLVTRITFVSGAAYSDGVVIKYNKSLINPSGSDVRATYTPMPETPFQRLFSEGKEINPRPPHKDNGMRVYIAAPEDESIMEERYVIHAGKQTNSRIPEEFGIWNSQFLTGTHIYEMVYWHSQLDWIDVREVLARTDAQGKGRLRYPMTDNAPSNRLYFKIYKPTKEEAAQGHKIEFLGEVDAKTQVPAFPYARPGDFSPRTGYWQAVGKTIDQIGGYHETFVKEGDSMPNLPGKIGVDPFSFQWKYVGEKSGKPAAQ